MKDNATDPLIDVAQLKVGMFIHLDLGWMSHPFPLSSFKIASADQLLILRRLGLTQVRWSPAKSDLNLQPQAEPAPAAADSGAQADAASPAEPSPEELAREAHRLPKRRLRAGDDGNAVFALDRLGAVQHKLRCGTVLFGTPLR